MYTINCQNAHNGGHKGQFDTTFLLVYYFLVPDRSYIPLVKKKNETNIFILKYANNSGMAKTHQILWVLMSPSRPRTIFILWIILDVKIYHRLHQSIPVPYYKSNQGKPYLNDFLSKKLDLIVCGVLMWTWQIKQCFDRKAEVLPPFQWIALNESSGSEQLPCDEETIDDSKAEDQRLEMRR